MSAVTPTFLLTDIEGSTRRWEQEPRAMEQALRRHDALLRALIDDGGGEVLETVGDAFQAAFPEPAAALAAALEIQRALAAEPWP
ncbi:MAG TPA: adenylate/guanylate cyclase domain-containing protein, partial [Herpetosiphonaceae bacterium]